VLSGVKLFYVRVCTLRLHLHAQVAWPRNNRHRVVIPIIPSSVCVCTFEKLESSVLASTTA
jgi:hypothetical protein